MDKKRVLFITQEMNPYLDLTEIGKIVRKMPQVTQEEGYEIRVLMPRFGNINERRNRLHEVVRLSGINIIIDDEDFPLIIKVASLPGARIQVYFLDNEDFFKRKFVFRDVKEKFYDDNAERTIFFCKGVLETVKKFGWAPDIIHCHGWMTSLVPLYLKTAYEKDPIFMNSKIIYSLYNQGFDEKLNKDFSTKAIVSDAIVPENLANFSGGNFSDLNKGAIEFSDAIIEGSADIPEIGDYKSIGKDKPWLEHIPDEDYAQKYLDFYKSLQ